MKVVDMSNWVYYVADGFDCDDSKVGSWMYIFEKGGREFAEGVCAKAVEEGAVGESRCSSAEQGLCCFYLDYDDLEGHKKILKYFMDNNLIRKTKYGRLYDMSFKLVAQTKGVEGSSDFKSDIKLSNFVNLDNGGWLV